MNENKRTAAYIRFKANVIDSDGGKRQQARILAYAKEHGINDIEIYAEAQTSANYKTTPSFDQLIADAKKGFYDCILVCDVARISRDMLKVGKILSFFDSIGVTVICAENGMCLTDPTSRLSEKIQKHNELLHKKDLRSRQIAAAEQRKRGRDNER
jgi:DNA invertase Pin-like site-specific DNA recombinase